MIWREPAKPFCGSSVGETKIFESYLRRQKTLVLLNESFFIQADRLGISSRVSVYIINTALPIVSHHTVGVYQKYFRNDDIQNYVLMICNSLRN